jgi:hypothetical protein
MKSLWKMILGTVTLMLILCAIIEFAGVIVLGASIIAYDTDPQPFYIITGAIGLAVAVFASVD